MMKMRVAHFASWQFQVNVAQYIYESIILSVPLRRIHPGVKDGSLSDVIEKLESLSQRKQEKKNNKIMILTLDGKI